MKRLTFLMFLMFVCVGLVSADEAIGVFANSNTNNLQFINPLTHKTSGPWLAGNLGTYGGGLFDVVICPKKKIAIVSNFGDSKIFFVDISCGFEGTPVLLGKTKLPFFAEDLAITPDEEYVLVTDGGFSARAAVVDIDGQYLVKNNNLGSNKYANAVDIGPDSQTVVFADYFQGKIYAYTLKDDYTLQLKNAVRVLPTRPVNVTISPDGKTVIAADAAGPFCVALSFDNQGMMYLSKIVQIPFRGGQSCVFNQAGTKAYYLSNSLIGGTQVVVLDVNGPGDVTVSGTNIKVTPSRGTSQLFGVDTIAIDPAGEYLYVANPTLSGGKARVSVIDLVTNVQVDSLPVNGIPTGIAFATIQN